MSQFYNGYIAKTDRITRLVDHLFEKMPTMRYC